MSKKGENIYTLKDNRCEARYVKGHAPDGSPQYGYCYGKSYREAKQKVLQARADFLSGALPAGAPPQRSLADCCDEWLCLNRDCLKASTYVKYKGILEKHIKPRLGRCPVRALSSLGVEKFSHQLLYEEGLSPKSVKDILTLLHAVLRHFHKQFPEFLPLIEIAYPKVPKNEMRVLSREEQLRFTQYLLQDMDNGKFGVLLALLTGMRIGEVCALRWEHISLSEKTVYICETMQRLQDFSNAGASKTHIVISEPKSNNSTRLVPLTDYVVRLCEERRCVNPAAFVLTGEARSYIEPRVMQYRLQRYTKECGLTGVHFHTLRHTFATRCVEVDFEIKSLSEILGHASPRITLERFVNSSMELKRENMNKLVAIGH